MKIVRYHIDKGDITEILAFALMNCLNTSRFIDFNATTVMTGSAGLTKLAAGCKSESDRFMSFKAGNEQFAIEAVYSSMMDSGLIDCRTYKGYPHLSYKMFVFHAGELVCEIEPKFPKKEEEE